MTTSELQEMWNQRIPEFPLTDAQADLWLALHTDTVLRKGIEATIAKWEREMRKMDEQYLLRYASKTMNNAKSRLEKTILPKVKTSLTPEKGDLLCFL